MIERAKLSDQKEKKGFVIWLTGLSGSGKSTLADEVYDSISANGNRVEKLDGDVMRGVFPATGFTREERDAHIKRVGFVASLLEKHDVIVVASFISPYRKARRLVRDMCSNFIEVFVSVSLDECERRDVKGLYKRARAGEIKDFTGIDAPYEEPQNAEIVVDTESQELEESLAQVMEYIKQYM
ncbi:MAG: adenylyl-sulfate kinase [Planctomycetes bacterium]|nr:adenylyl-sulfate kinase [Planctomycetota bacterium]